MTSTSHRTDRTTHPHRELAYPDSRFARLDGIEVHYLDAAAGRVRPDAEPADTPADGRAVAPATQPSGSRTTHADGRGVPPATQRSGSGTAHTDDGGARPATQPSESGAAHPGDRDPGHGPTTALLSHHFYGSAATWRDVLGGLGDELPTVALDRPGFGLTERPHPGSLNGFNPYSRAGAAELGWALLDRLGNGDAVLIGSSAGGTHVLEMYAQQPRRVRALVLIGAAITGDVGPPAALRPLLRTPPLRRVGPHIVDRLAGEVTADRVTRSWAVPSRADHDVADPYQRMLRVEGWQRGLWAVLTADQPPDLRRLLSRIDVPTLVVTGDRDPVVHPEASRRTAAAVPAARFVSIEDCGHTPQEERPEALREAIRGFLADVGIVRA